MISLAITMWVMSVIFGIWSGAYLSRRQPGSAFAFGGAAFVLMFFAAAYFPD